MNFAYDKVKDGKGWSKPLKDMRAQLGGLDYFNDLYTPVIELHYWADDSNIIAVGNSPQNWLRALIMDNVNLFLMI